MLPRNPELSQHASLWKDRHAFLTSMPEICARHGLNINDFVLCTGGSNVVFEAGHDFIIKLFFPFLREQFETERLVLPLVSGALGIRTPEIIASGEHDGWPYIVMTRIEGASLGSVWSALQKPQKLSLMRQLGRVIARLHDVSVAEVKDRIPVSWPRIFDRQLGNAPARHRSKGMSERLLAQLPEIIDSVRHAPDIRSDGSLITGDFTPDHILVAQEGAEWKIIGLIDFADCMLGPRAYDFTGPATFITAGEPDLLKTLFLSYGYVESDLTPVFRRKLMALILLHRFADFDAQIKVPDWKTRFHGLDDLERFLFNLS